MPSTPKPIKITVTSGKKGQPITVRNRTTGDIINNKDGTKTVLQATAQAVVDLQNSTNGYTAGDVIDFIVMGEVLGANSLTTSGTAPESITVSTASIGTTLTRGI